MKKTSLLAFGLLATALALIGAHSLAERFDPTSRAVQEQTVGSLADGGISSPCSSCEYLAS